MSDEVQLLHNWVDEHRDEMVEALQGVLRIPSVQGLPEPGGPYGVEVLRALEYTLDLCARLGFRVKNVDGHAGHAEFGEGAEMVAAIGHLDVVPEGGGWTHPPFAAEIADGFIYSRGASDDKGPTYAALFGAKALMDCGLPIERRVRLVFGCNEESGFGCVKHYWEVAKEERPAYAFTPDACFPMIYAEKGIANIVLRKARTGGGQVHVACAAGGMRPNMVPERAEATLVGGPAELYAAVEKLQSYWDRNVTFRAEPQGVVVVATGKSAHGASPQDGDNAVARLARALLSVGMASEKEWLDWVVRTCDPAGSGLGIEGRDAIAGPLTCNLGILDCNAEQVTLTYNVRYPVTWDAEELPSRLRAIVGPAGWEIVECSDSRPLHAPLDREPAKTLLRIYQDETGDRVSKPETMGGGTYARATPNTVAYGPAIPGGTDGPAHEPNERFAIDSLVRAAKIYAHALYELANLE